MTPFLQLSISLAVLIFAAKAAGYISLRLGQPSVLGELLVGVLLGPSLVNWLNLPFITDINLTTIIHEFADLGVLFIVFLAGLDLHLNDLTKSGKISATGFLFVVPVERVIGFGKHRQGNK